MTPIIPGTVPDPAKLIADWRELAIKHKDNISECQRFTRLADQLQQIVDNGGCRFTRRRSHDLRWHRPWKDIE